MPRQTLSAVAPLIFFFSLSVLFSVWGCAPLDSGYESPSVSISSFRIISNRDLSSQDRPGNTPGPRFKIGLHIINPNRIPLELKGLAYTITLEDHKIITGVANDLPKIDAYGEGEVLVQAGMDLFSSILFFTELARNPNHRELNYSFEAKLDLGTFLPVMRVSRNGKFNLKPDF